jgi:hypothetical protein
MWKDADITSGSVAATGLITQQRANRLGLCTTAIMATPQVVIGLVFMTVAERADKAATWCGRSLSFKRQPRCLGRRGLVCIRRPCCFRCMQFSPYLLLRC